MSDLLTTADLRAKGLRPRTGERPAHVKERRGLHKGKTFFWRLDQAVPLKPRDLTPSIPPVTQESVLRAVWTVNRAAKRRRDAASSTYALKAHSFAGQHRLQKQLYYGLKDRGIAWLAHHGHAVPSCRHGGLVVWTAGAWRFHSTLLPIGRELPDSEPGSVWIEAKPRHRTEMRIVDAVALLRSIPSVVSNHDRVPAPARQQFDDWQDEDEDED